MAKKKSNVKKSIRKLKKLKSPFLIAAVIVLGLYFLGLGFRNDIDVKLGLARIEYYSAGNIVEVGGMTVHFIDVGQGDACLIELPDNRTMLVDAGERNDSVQTKLSEYFDSVNDKRESQNLPKIEYLDYMVMTHSDSDHIGSAAYILDLYPAKTFYRPNQQATYKGYVDPALDGDEKRNRFWGDKHGEKDTLTYKNALEAAYSAEDFTPEGIVTNPHDETQNTIAPNLAKTHENYYEINFYGPVNSYYSAPNDYSPIMIVEYQSRRIALSGDSEGNKEGKGEKDFIQAIESGDARYAIFDANYSVDVIKLGHHGSSTSSSEAYLEAISTAISRPNIFAIISCGKDNKYGHPHQEVLTAMYEMGFKEANVMRTDEKGDIVVSVKKSDNGYALTCGENVAVKTEMIYAKHIGSLPVNYALIGGCIAVVLCLILVICAFAAKAKD